VIVIASPPKAGVAIWYFRQGKLTKKMLLSLQTKKHPAIQDLTFLEKGQFERNRLSY
jgi:hypothetical protein